MMIFNKAIPRRTFLRGAAATLALPLLDSMIPAFASAETSPAVRLAFVYAPNGMIMEHWTPRTEGTGFELPLILEPRLPSGITLPCSAGSARIPLSRCPATATMRRMNAPAAPT